MPRAKPNPSHSGNMMAYRIDITRAWERAELPLEDRTAVFLILGLGWTHRETSQAIGMARSTVGDRVTRAVGVLTSEINGMDYQEEETE